MVLVLTQSIIGRRRMCSIDMHFSPETGFNNQIHAAFFILILFRNSILMAKMATPTRVTEHYTIVLDGDIYRGGHILPDEDPEKLSYHRALELYDKLRIENSQIRIWQTITQGRFVPESEISKALHDR